MDKTLALPISIHEPKKLKTWQLFIALVTISFDFILNKAIYYLISFSLLFFTMISIVFMIFGIENCGCFGTIIIDKPVISIIKNVILFTILYVLKKKSINKQYE